MNNFFVNLKQVYNNPEQRTIEYLKLLYNDNYLLVEIERLLRMSLSEDNILGKKILLKPNWVLHNRKVEDEICMRTHDNFLLAALEVVLRFKPASIIIGDAPVQGCRWDEVVTPKLVAKVNSLSEQYKVPIKIKDFRRVTFDPSINNLTLDRNKISDYIIFDVGSNSFLEPISRSGKNIFRVNAYHPDRLSESHRPGVHKYCITKELFDCEVIITLPKVKTHQKTGITNALKILVGVNGDKDFLPHHRKGGSAEGGDCYPGKNILRSLAELILDAANRRRGKRTYKLLVYLSAILWKLSFPTSKENLAAAWYGNDTTWRMTLDLNLIAKYGREDGKIDRNPQRVIYSLSDGIIGGQGDGPLNAEPLALGFICFSNNSEYTDAAMAKLMGFNIEKIPLIKNSLKWVPYKKLDLFLNNEKIDIDELSNYSIKTTPPPGWINFL